MSYECAPLSDADLADVIAEMETPVIDDPTLETPVRPKIAAATSEQGEKAIDDILNDFPGIAEKSSHWSLTLMSIIHTISYRPRRNTLFNPKGYSAETGAGSFVLDHVSPEVLEDVRASVVEWVSLNPGALTMEGVEGAVFIDGDALAYQAETVTVETSSASQGKEGWASW